MAQIEWTGLESECNKAHELLTLAVKARYISGDTANDLFAESNLQKIRSVLNHKINIYGDIPNKYGNLLVMELML